MLPLDADPDFCLLHEGPYAPGEVVVETQPSSLAPLPVDDAPWQRAKARLGDRLFDGPMCRYEGHEVAAGQLRLRVSRTGYKHFLCTNLEGPPDLPDNVLARPVGVSAVLETGDGFLLLGRRGGGVAYYPHRIHPFAGSLEWPEQGELIDIFAECRRELHEELRLSPADVPGLVLLGVVEDVRIRHPELLLHARTPLPAEAVSARLDAAEHDAVVRLPATHQAIASVLQDRQFTPVARATLTLLARHWLQRPDEGV